MTAHDDNGDADCKEGICDVRSNVPNKIHPNHKTRSLIPKTNPTSNKLKNEIY